MIHTFVGHTDAVREVKTSKDGKYVFTSSWDNTARMFNTITGKCVHVFKGHSGLILTMALSSDDKYLFTGSSSNAVHIFDTATGKCIHVFEKLRSSVEKIILGQNYLFIHYSDYNVDMLSLITRKCVHSFGNAITSIDVSLDEKYIFTVSLDCMRIFDSETRRCVHKYKKEKIAPGDKFIITGKDGKHFFIISKNGTVSMYDIASRECVNVYGNYTGWMKYADISKNYLFTVSIENDVCMFEISTGKRINMFYTSYNISAIKAFNNNKYVLISCSRENKVCIFHISTGECVQIFSALPVVELSENNKYIICLDGNNVKMFNIISF